MFTGLIQTMGVLAERSAHGPGFHVAIAAALPPLAIGESIAVNGVCVTVTESSDKGFGFDLSLESVERTTLGRLEIGAPVNLERALRAGDALGGHFVSGHVDGVGTVETVTTVGEAKHLTIRSPAELARYLAPKGSVAVDGVSLTINGAERGSFEVMLIPHTIAVTNLKQVAAGSEVNLEVDLLARYAAHFLETAAVERAQGESVEKLARTGWIP